MTEGRASLGGVERADDDMYHELVARAGQAIKTGSRTTPCRVRDDIVRERVHKALLTVAAEQCQALWAVLRRSPRTGDRGRPRRMTPLLPDGAVDQLAHRIGVSGMAGGLVDQVQEDPAQGRIGP